MLQEIKKHISVESDYSFGLLTIQPFSKGNLKSLKFYIEDIDSSFKFIFTANKSILTRLAEISKNIKGYYSSFNFVNETQLEYKITYTHRNSSEEVANSFNNFYTKIMNITSNSRNIIIEFNNQNYVFTEKRAIHAFSILNDLEWHTRTEIEGIQEDGTRTYGDPSRTVTVLEECGFTLERGYTIENGQRMQQYKLLSLEQDIENIKRRTTITKKMKLQIFERDQYRCAICQNVFEESQLEPDHKTPVQIQDDQIDTNNPNWMDKLQTMCKICNGRKREVCKKCETLDCDNCPWCHPDKLLTSFVRISSESYKSALINAEKVGETVESYLEKLIEKGVED